MTDESYYLIRFLDSKQEAEIRGVLKIQVLEALYSDGVIEGGEINNNRLETFVFKHGLDETGREVYIE